MAATANRLVYRAPYAAAGGPGRQLGAAMNVLEIAQRRVVSVRWILAVSMGGRSWLLTV